MFIVQESIHADHLSRHKTREAAVAAIEEMVRSGLAEPREFNIREINSAGKTVGVFGTPAPDSPGAPDGTPAFTEREREVLRSLADGLSNNEIAQRLSLSPKTVGVHISAVLDKLGASTRSEAVTTARRQAKIA